LGIIGNSNVVLVLVGVFIVLIFFVWVLQLLLVATLAHLGALLLGVVHAG